MITALAAALTLPLAGPPASDAKPLLDPMRPVSRIDRDSFTLQYVTAAPCETLVQVREGELPMAAYLGPGKRNDPFGTLPVSPGSDPRALSVLGRPKIGGRYVMGAPGKRTFHTVTVRNLRPGRRYFYRIYDPAADPTSQEREWGAVRPWRREFAVSTQAPAGRKTIVHLPVKVLLMPNVVNVESGVKAGAPRPPRMTQADIDRIRSEFAVSARFFWVNSGMRLWVDYQFFIDDRWQRWGPEPEGADAFYRGWPVSRSYAGQDFAGPGGGDFTILDTTDPLRVTKEPVVERFPYSAQIEMAWVRRWNPQSSKWEFYNSGGGTFAVDGFPRGFPGRSQFLGGGDAAWLATHELHHNLESHGAFSLSHREDDRIVFNHYAARRRSLKPDGSADENTWSTSGRHGEHWDGMAFWDRSLTDAQWLRMYFGRTMTVADADEDGLPDNDPRLPLDERRFGSDAKRAATDGITNDLQKAMFSTWVPGPLQSSWIKPPYQGLIPNPRTPDTDGDGLTEDVDPYPLYPNPPFIPFRRASVDGRDDDWTGVPEAASVNKGGIRLTFRQAHDESAYTGVFRVSGAWRRIDATFDGEGLGVYSGVGVLGFQLTRNGDRVDVRPTFGGAPGLKLVSTVAGDQTVIEFSLPNRGESPWFWTRGGRDVGVVLNVWDADGRGYSAWEPYRPFYARMLEPHGKEPLPPNPPSELQAGPGVTIHKPGDGNVRLERGWRLEQGAWSHSGEESALWIPVPGIRDFDLLAIVEAKSDGIVAAFLPGQAMTAGEGYVGFVGGYGNRVTRMRVLGQERGDEPVVMTPGPHRIQLSRRQGELWLLVDGKPVIYAVDPSPGALVDRLAVLGGYGGAQVVREIRLRR